MDFSLFLKNIPKIKSAKPGGITSHFKMAPAMRIKFDEWRKPKKDPQSAAVLALFYPDENNKTRFILTERAQYNGVHSAQISFPGGKQNISDKDLSATALRETYEEISATNIALIRELTRTYIPPSNFYVTPFLGYLGKEPLFKPNNEVEKIIPVLLSDLLDETSVSSKNLSTSYMKNIDVPCFKLNNYIVWGATAMLLSEIKDLIKGL